MTLNLARNVLIKLLVTLKDLIMMRSMNILGPVLAQDPRLEAPAPPNEMNDHITLDDHLTAEMRALRIWMMSAGNILRPVLAQGPRLGAPAPLEIINGHPMLKTTLADRITAKLRALRIWMIDAVHEQGILNQLLVQEPRLAAPGPPAADDDRLMLKETLADRISLKMRALRIWMSDKHHDRNILSPLLAQEPRLMGPARPKIPNDNFLVATPLAERITLEMRAPLRIWMIILPLLRLTTHERQLMRTVMWTKKWSTGRTTTRPWRLASSAASSQRSEMS